jgi:hypothetical protein
VFGSVSARGFTVVESFVWLVDVSKIDVIPLSLVLRLALSGAMRVSCRLRSLVVAFVKR